MTSSILENLQNRCHVFLFVLGLVSLAGLFLFLACTRWGVGLTEDSFDYITAAESVVLGKGIGRTTGLGEFRPLTHFPPLFSLVLAGLRSLGVDFYSGARALNALMYGLLVFLAGLAVWKVTHSVAFSLLAAVLALSSEALLDVSSWALTEPMFLVLGSAGLVCLAEYLRRPPRSVYLIGAGLIIGIAYLTRYVGLLLVTAALAGMVLSPLPRDSRHWRDILLLFGLSSGPMAVWMGRNIHLIGNPVDRPPLSWHPPDLQRWEAGVRTALTWVLPDIAVNQLRGLVGVVALGLGGLLAAACVVWLVLDKRHRARDSGEASGDLSLLLACYAATYLVGLLIAVTWLDRRTPLDNRLLSPFYYTGLALGVSFVATLWKRAPKVLRLLLLAVVAAFLLLQIHRGVAMAQILRQDARGFAGSQWRTSPTIGYIRTLPQVPIYSNEIQPIYFMTGRLASFTPARYNPAADADRPDYRQWLDQMRHQLKFENGVLVLFGTGPSDSEPSEYAELTEGLSLVHRFDDGEIYIDASSEP